MISNGETPMKKIGRNRKARHKGEIFQKKSWRTCKNVTCRGVFEQQKRKPIFGVFKLHFLKTLVLHRYIRPITCQYSILRCGFFFKFANSILGQNAF